MSQFKAACLQVNSSNDLHENIATVYKLAAEARSAGADMIFTPENVAMMEWGRSNIVLKAMPEETHLALKAFRDLAAELNCWFHIGSLAISLDDGKVANRSFVLNPKGEIVARYTKIHMFDVDLGGGQTYCESATFAPGNEAVLVDLPWGKLGLSICYDLRFPHLYRRLAQAGAHILTVPAAFTKDTGKAHWHVLLRARAIETGSYILAPAQVGTHANNRETYGHALIISPWGEVLADALLQPGWILADIDPQRVGDCRKKIPSLYLNPPYSLKEC